MNEAALRATRRGAELITIADFTSAVERIVAGLEKRHRLLNPRERETIAFHEMGHVLVALSQPGADPVHKVSIIPRGIGALGYTIQRPTEDRYLMTRAEFERRIAVLLGGRAAEQLVFGELSSGAADDLAKATDIARQMVTRYGMDEQLGPVAYDHDRSPFLESPLAEVPRQDAVSERTQQRIDEAIRAFVMAGLAQATGVLSTHRAVLERTARALIASETLDEAALRALTPELRG